MAPLLSKDRASPVSPAIVRAPRPGALAARWHRGWRAPENSQPDAIALAGSPLIVVSSVSTRQNRSRSWSTMIHVPEPSSSRAPPLTSLALNTMQEAFLYRAHADGSLESYRRFLDPALFGGRFEHLCGLRTVLAMVARRMHERGVEADDHAAIGVIDIEVARLSGHLPASGRRATATRRSY